MQTEKFCCPLSPTPFIACCQKPYLYSCSVISARCRLQQFHILFCGIFYPSRRNHYLCDLYSLLLCIFQHFYYSIHMVPVRMRNKYRIQISDSPIFQVGQQHIFSYITPAGTSAIIQIILPCLRLYQHTISLSHIQKDNLRPVSKPHSQ